MMERRSRQNEEKNKDGFQEKLIRINRISKVLKGGRRFSFSALVIIGNKAGQVGYGFGKALDVSESIRKAIENGRKNLIRVPIIRTTLPHEIYGKFNKSVVLLKPATQGTGIIAGGPVRVILELSGYGDVLSKSLGSRNTINVIRAVFEGLKELTTLQEVAKRRGISKEDVIKP